MLNALPILRYIFVRKKLSLDTSFPFYRRSFMVSPRCFLPFTFRIIDHDTTLWLHKYRVGAFPFAVSLPFAALLYRDARFEDNFYSILYRGNCQGNSATF